MFTPVNIFLMTSRAAYHHGDLRNALIAAAATLAEEGGPDAVTIRAAARAVGVTPTAAYRHFAGHEDLLKAAKDQSMQRMGDAMRRRLDALPAESDPARTAMARLEAIGRGYVDFALSEPGLFRTAFCRDHEALPESSDGDRPLGPRQLLATAVDELVGLGFVEPEQRMGLEIGAWSVVHGLSMLLLDGPLSKLSEAEQRGLVDQTMDTMVRSFWTMRASLQAR